MTQRDELAALVHTVTDPANHDAAPYGEDYEIADAIRARYRLEERKPPSHDVFGWEPIGNGMGLVGPLVVDGVLTCHTCREPWPCPTILQRNPPR